MEEQTDHEKALQIFLIKQQARDRNHIGLTGFILSLIALGLGWIPLFGQILWGLGFSFSIVGVFGDRKGFSVAGMIISVISIILFVFVDTSTTLIL
jgi:hypothetical protein